MKFERTQLLPDVIVVDPDVHRDPRGFFLESYHAAKYAKGGIPDTFVQDNHSFSTRGTIRGLHAQSPHPQAKLIRVIRGEIHDVVVDIRPGSRTFGKYIDVVLSQDNYRQIYVPIGFAHGFCVLSEVAEVEYKCSEVYHADAQLSIAWNDPDIGIPWPVKTAVLSDKDREAPRLKEVTDRIEIFRL